jgi:predicted ABC-type ATPase
MVAAGKPPRMIVLAGPIASGKTTRFRSLQRRLQVDSFNVDDRSAELNNGSYQNIPESISAVARKECEAFVRGHVDQGRSFMVETTLRTLVSIEQARVASTAGFRTEMIFVAVADVAENVRRARIREGGGGRAVTEETIWAVHRASMEHLAVALREFHHVTVIDNTGVNGRRVLETDNGEVVLRLTPTPAWLVAALAGTEYE